MDLKSLPRVQTHPGHSTPLLRNCEQEKLWKVATEFEAIFIKQMLDAMRKTLSKDKLLGGGMAEDIFEDMLYQERALSMAKNGNFGLTKTLYHQLSQIQSLKGHQQK